MVITNKVEIPKSRLCRFDVPTLKSISTNGKYSKDTRHYAVMLLRTKFGYELIG